jgi:hypothetical protein
MSDPTAKETFAGSAVEIDGSGDYLINTTQALGGDMRVQLGDGRALVIEIGGVPAFQVSRHGSTVRVDLGGRSSERLVLGDAFMELLNQFFEQKFEMHVHPTPMGPSGPPLPAFTGTRMTEEQLSSVARTKRE